MAQINNPEFDSLAEHLRNRIHEGLNEYVQKTVAELVEQAKTRIEAEARDYAARVVLSLVHTAEVREMRDRLVIELKLPPQGSPQ